MVTGLGRGRMVCVLRTGEKERIGVGGHVYWSEKEETSSSGWECENNLRLTGEKD